MKRQTVSTVGELKELLEKYPNDKPLICDCDGNTWNPEFYNWADGENEDITEPLAINCDYGL